MGARGCHFSPGGYGLDVHGTDSTVQLVENDGALRELSPDDFAVVVRNTGRDGQPIRLFSCDTGASPNGFAQELADELGVAVTAPDNLVWSDSFGVLQS